MAERKGVRVVVAYSPRSRQVVERNVDLAEGDTVKVALLASGLLADFPALVGLQPTVGIWGRKAPLTRVLEEGDRVEIYRPLTVDPKVARRERFQRLGARGAGLFAKRRPGGKAGY
jgi:uncharacterized protein